MLAALLPDRGVIRIVGEDARRFLNGIVTNDIERLVPGEARYAALLTPQGKIVVDFLVAEAGSEDGGGFFIDVPKALASVLAQKLGFYKLRAKVTIEDLSDRLGVMAVWNDQGAVGHIQSEYGLCFADPRLAALGSRIIVPPQVAGEAAADLGAGASEPAAYDAHRITLGVPRGGEDFVYGGTFPHEADLDQLHGVDFHKGCYIGQEVVSRVEHRATARSRVVPVIFEGGAPMQGLEVVAADKTIGMMGSAANGRGLALLRLDRAADAVVAGIPITSGGVALQVAKPGWAAFPFPGEAKAAE
ncbi:MAG: folate-binding protein YgfZ [Proteobacteria bacterium]|nr:folate-binding protein YgfZ [Pseudomonadota bacterium]